MLTVAEMTPTAGSRETEFPSEQQGSGGSEAAVTAPSRARETRETLQQKEQVGGDGGGEGETARSAVQLSLSALIGLPRRTNRRGGVS